MGRLRTAKQSLPLRPHLNASRPATPPQSAPGLDESLTPPPTDEFRQDLLNAVCERTGYPLEMLKEDALLEADLGIDSIKTVEIFGSLTRYHKFMPGSGGFDEELLSEFAKLKTLGDIVAMYERGRSGQHLTPNANSNGAATVAVSTEAAPVRPDSFDRSASGEPSPATDNIAVHHGGTKWCRRFRVSIPLEVGSHSGFGRSPDRSAKKKFPSGDLVLILGDASTSTPRIAELLKRQELRVFN